ncbi:hypothetical protein HDU98_005656 [Podochytrium sp. JEL0797]|nr:hypothetical protein HDU98_005656 [Podochytrium sp. JEL0797]
MDIQRKLLEELMNPLLGTTKTYKDPQMCPHMLACGFCPFDLFTNTKCDIGNCDKKVHDEKLVKEYQNSPDRYKLGHEQAFYNLTARLIGDMDRMIRRQKDKVAENEAPPPGHAQDGLGDEKEERLAMIEGQIREYHKQMQEAGEGGFVDRAVDLWGTVELLKNNVEAIKNSVNNRRHMICDICSATLVHNDSTQRLQDHLTGKQHIGYKKLREWAKEWEARIRDERGGDRSGPPMGGGGGYGDRGQVAPGGPGGWGGRRDERDMGGRMGGGDFRDRSGYGGRDDGRRGGGGYDRDYRRGGGGGGGGYGRR